jgi:hypothetical protein
LGLSLPSRGNPSSNPAKRKPNDEPRFHVTLATELAKDAAAQAGEPQNDRTSPGVAEQLHE